MADSEQPSSVEERLGGQPEAREEDLEALEEALLSALAEAMPGALRGALGTRLAEIARALAVPDAALSPTSAAQERSLIDRTLGRLARWMTPPAARQPTAAEKATAVVTAGAEATTAGAAGDGEAKEARPTKDLLVTWIETALRDERVKALTSEGDGDGGAVPREVWTLLCDQFLDAPVPDEAKSRGLWAMAELAWKLGSPEGTLFVAARKREFDRGRGDVAGLARALELIADVLERQGKIDEAISIRREELLPALAQLGQHRRRAVVLGRIGDRLQEQGKLTEALAIRHEQLPVYEELGEIMERAVVRTKIADVLMARGENGEALHLFRDALRVLETAEHPRNQAITLGKIARLLSLAGRHDEALRLRREQEIPIYERLGDDKARAVAIGGIADTMQAQGHVGEALRLRREEELPIYERTGDTRQQATTLGKMADVLLMTRRFDEALATYRKVAGLFAGVGDESGRLTAQSRVADVLEQQGDLGEAMRLRKEDLAGHTRAGDEPARAVTMAKIGATLHAQGRSGEALALLRDEVLPALERLDLSPQRAHVLGTVADILLSGGKAADALRGYREALPLVQRTGDLRTEGLVLCKMAAAHRALKQDEEALRVLKKEAAPLFQRTGDLRERAHAMRQAAEIHEARRQLDAAVQVLKEDVVGALERVGDEQGLIGERARLALVCLKRNATGDRKLARDLLRKARQGAEARGMPYAQEIRKMQRLFKLEPN